ncbi:MAG: gliding motility-associated C-terminal domain-containing protein, partial [Saprospiraceae bacterium]
PSPLCAIGDMLDLSTLFVAGEVGSWAVSSSPPGSNPATLSGNIFTTNSSDPGNYIVTYTLDNPQTGCPFTSSETVTVLDIIIPNAGPDITNCGPGVIALIGMPAPISPVSILWHSLGDGTFSNASSQATIYTPGSLDSISSVISIVYKVIDPICGNQSDTMNLFFNSSPFAIFPNDTFYICNETDKGSILNFPSLITGGDVNGIWTNTSGVPVNFSNPASVDFNGIAEGFYTFTYQTNSAIPPCQNTSYTIVVSVRICLCPIITIQSLPGGICNSQQDLALNAFVMAGAPGTWAVLSTPPGNNPATVVGNNLQILGVDPGIYALRFTFDSAPIVSCPDSADIQVLIQDAPTISITSDTAICGVGDISLNASLGGSATNAVWFTSGTGIFDNVISLNPVYTPSNGDLASGQIRLISKTVDTLGFCQDALDTMFVNFASPPFVNWSSLMDTICNQADSGSVINLLSHIIGGDPSGSWSDLDGASVNLSNPANVNFDGVPPGIYHFKYLTQSAVSPCMDVSYIFQVLVEDCACPYLEISDITNTICIPSSIDLDALIVKAAPGNWSIISGPFGTWPVIAGNTVVTDNADVGSYRLKYSLTDSVVGCAASKVISFTLDASPVVMSTSIDCDADLLHYSVAVTTNAITLNSDFGTVVSSLPGVFTIQSIPAGQNIVLQLNSSFGSCTSSFSLTAPDCSCTLMIEDLADTIFLCKGDTFTLIPLVTNATGIPFNTWIGPGFSVQRPSFKIFKDGTFIWSVKDSLCERRDTFTVHVYDAVVPEYVLLPPFCPGGSDGMIIINSISQGIDPFSVQLDNGSVFIISAFPDTLKLVSAGLHTLIISDLNGCESSYAVTVPDPTDRFLNLGPDITITKGDSVLITPQLINLAVSNFLWNGNPFNLGLQPQWIIPEETTSLLLTVTDSSGCTFQDDILITVITEQHFYLPTIFSPNGDQVNDLFIIETSSDQVNIVSLEIFDRWGDLVFIQIDNPPFAWDGTFKNQRVQPGVYILKLRYKDDKGNDQYHVNDITLIR